MPLRPPDRWCRARTPVWPRRNGSPRSGRNRATLPAPRLAPSAISLRGLVSLLWCASPSGFGPARGGGIILAVRLNPGDSGRAFLALPERRIGFKVIHQELRRLERRLPVLGRGHHQHDILAGGDAADA